MLPNSSSESVLDLKLDCSDVPFEIESVDHLPSPTRSGGFDLLSMAVKARSRAAKKAKIESVFKFRSAKDQQSRAERTASLDRLFSLIACYGNSIHTAWIDPAYSLFESKTIDGVVGYVKHLGCAVVFGEPLSAPEAQFDLATEFEAFCKSRKLAPIYCSTRSTFAKEVTASRGGYLQYGVEEFVAPVSNKTSKNLRQIIRKAASFGVTVAERVDTKTKEGDDKFGCECAQLLERWQSKRKGPQMCGSSIRPLGAPSMSRWFCARDANGTLIGLLTMSRLSPGECYSIEHCIADADAPQGVVEWLVDAAIGALREEGVEHLSFGVAAATEFGETQGLSPRAEEIARKMYSRVDKWMKFNGKLVFHSKFGVKRREPQYICWVTGKSLGFKQMLAIIMAMNPSNA